MLAAQGFGDEAVGDCPGAAAGIGKAGKGRVETVDSTVTPVEVGAPTVPAAAVISNRTGAAKEGMLSMIVPVTRAKAHRPMADPQLRGRPKDTREVLME